MTADVGVLVIHGIGSQKKGFADDLIDEVNDRIETAGHSSSQIAWETVYWADITEPEQVAYLQRANADNDLDWYKLRKFVTSALGDASAYRMLPDNPPSSTYARIHQRVSESVTRLYTAGLDSQPKPMIVLAHSLGCHIMSNYIWDMQKQPDMTLAPFERMEKLTGLIMFGCNMPLFTFAHTAVKPITFPPTKLPKHLKTLAKWENYYDPDDILGYPLKPINDDYRKVVDADIAINVGGLLSNWQPQSHTKYWTDNDFTKPVARYIGQFL